MMSKKCYNFVPNGIYKGVGIAQPNPLQKGSYLINPKDRTLVPPECIDENGVPNDGQIPVWDFENEIWVTYSDNRTNNNDIIIDSTNKVVRNKTNKELVEEGLLVLDKYSRVNEDDVIIKYTLGELLEKNIINEDAFNKYVIRKEINIRNVKLNAVLDKIDRHKNELESISLGLLEATSCSDEEYKEMLQERINLCNFQNSVDYEYYKNMSIEEDDIQYIESI